MRDDTPMTDIKFTYYVIDIVNGVVLGTNDLHTAEHWAAADDNFVIDAANATWLFSDGSSEDIEEAVTVEDELETEGDDEDDEYDESESLSLQREE